MSSKEVDDSKKLEEDLTEEVEEDQEADGDKEKEGGTVEANKDRLSSSETEVSQTADNFPPKKRTRKQGAKSAQLKTKPKRRRTSDSEYSDLSEKAASVDIDNEPVPGPSSGVAQSSDKGVRNVMEIDPINDEREDEMDTDLSNEAPIGGSSAVDNPDVNIINQSRHPVMDEEAPTSSSKVLNELPVDKSLIGIPRGQRLNPPSTRSAVLEEIFRMPIYESDSRRSVFDTERPFDDEDDGLLTEEIPGPSDSKARTSQSKRSPNEQSDGSILLQEKQRMIWARKIFFRSTELIFPGFARYANAQTKRKECMAVRVRSSCVLQALLYADLLFFIMWFLAFLSTFDIAIAVLKELHGNLVVCMTALFSLVNIPRLLFGIRGNENDKMEFLALFWMMTFIVQAPLFGFILFTDVFTPIRLAFTLTMDSIMMVFILLEVIVGTIHLKNLIRDELKVIELAKKSEQMVKGRQGDSNLRPRVVNTADGPVVNWEAEDDDIDDDLHKQRRPSGDHSDDDWSTDESVEGFSRNALGRDPAVDYQLKIRRLRTEQLEEPERDDSNQVSSTSDSIRQRQINVI